MRVEVHASAFERLYRAHAVRIRRLVGRMLEANEVDDVAQDVFVRAWEKLSTYRGEAAFGTWLHRLAVNVILTRRRALGVEQRRYRNEPASLDDLSSPLERPGDTVDLHEAIGRLPSDARWVFVLYDVAGYTHDEIAELLDVAPGTSKWRLHRARRSLRRFLDG